MQRPPDDRTYFVTLCLEPRIYLKLLYVSESINIFCFFMCFEHCSVRKSKALTVPLTITVSVLEIGRCLDGSLGKPLSSLITLLSSTAASFEQILLRCRIGESFEFLLRLGVLRRSEWEVIAMEFSALISLASASFWCPSYAMITFTWLIGAVCGPFRSFTVLSGTLLTNVNDQKGAVCSTVAS